VQVVPRIATHVVLVLSLVVDLPTVETFSFRLTARSEDVLELPGSFLCKVYAELIFTVFLTLNFTDSITELSSPRLIMDMKAE